MMASKPEIGLPGSLICVGNCIPNVHRYEEEWLTTTREKIMVSYGFLFVVSESCSTQVLYDLRFQLGIFVHRVLSLHSKFVPMAFFLAATTGNISFLKKDTHRSGCRAGSYR
uniref:Uncharacterized protein n=1 Tax=Schistocephalus solidus TaxID=70667 RepID=A0A0X3PPR0_SCHSO